MQRVAGEFTGASTSNASVTQEGAVDSPEMQQRSPRRECTCERAGEEISERRRLWQGRPGICCACAGVTLLLGLLCY